MRAEGSVLCRDAKTGRFIASLSKGGGSVAHMGRSLTIPENATVRERARRTYLQDWRATKNDTPVQNEVSATAEALGRMIAVLSERPGYSSEELTKYGQNAVSHFARETLAFRQTRKG
jgi:hypothetical protein